MKGNVLTVKELNNCTGCAMCQGVCPTGAIQVSLSEQGFYEPQINNEKCVSCSLCTNVCYKCDGEYSVKEAEDYTCYSAINKDEKILKESSSGGASYQLMKECLSQGYFVVGVAYDVNTGSAVTRIARNEAELEQFKGSKYFQSYTVDAVREILSDKSEQRYAIFGTPCQIYSYSKMAELKGNREKFVFVDIFCHGCPSKNLWDKYLDFVRKENGVEDFKEISFRSKAYGWHEYCFDFKADEKSFHSSKYNDPFHEVFFSLDAMNKACYDCIARSTVEKTDIRIGDFWGKRFNEDSKGVSAVVVASEKGEKLFDAVKDKFITEKADFNEIISAQSYKKTHKYNEERREKILSMLSGEEAIEKIVNESRKGKPLAAKVKRVVKQALKHLPQPIYFKIKSIIN